MEKKRTLKYPTMDWTQNLMCRMRTSKRMRVRQKKQSPEIAGIQQQCRGQRWWWWLPETFVRW